MKDAKNGARRDLAQAFLASAMEALQEQDLQEAIAPGTQQIARQLREIENITSNIQSLIAERVKAQLMELVQREMRRTFAQALGTAAGSPLDSILGEETGQRLAATRSQVQRHPVEVGPEVELPGKDDAAWRMSPRLRVPQHPASAPAFWLVTGPDEKGRPSAGAPQDGEVQAPGICQAYEAVGVAEKEPEAVAQAVAVLDAALNEAAGDKTPPASPDDEVFEGSVRLNIETTGCIRDVVHFVEELRQKPQFRLLQLMGNQRDSANIMMGLREPVPLKRVLLQMPGVSQVTAPVGCTTGHREHLFTVRLGSNIA